MLLSHLELAHVERLANGDLVDRFFVAVPFFVAHHERARRDQHEVDFDAAAEVETDFLLVFRAASDGFPSFGPCRVLPALHPDEERESKQGDREQ